MGGDEVAGVFGEFVLRQPAHDPVDRGRRHGEEQGAADEFEESVEPFQDDADFEGPVEKVLGPEPAHSGPPSRFSQIGSDKAWYAICPACGPWAAAAISTRSNSGTPCRRTIPVANAAA